VPGLVLVDASQEDQEMEMPGIAPFVPLLSAVGVFRFLQVSFGPSPDFMEDSVRRFARATAFRTAAYNATADEGLHLPESAAEVRANRRKLTIPVVVLTAGRSAGADWLRLQRDQAALSDQGCQVVVEQSGHAMALDQPPIVVQAIRRTVDRARGRRDVPLCP
jgi:pimeloyl-ACP methyl ester carboxylesterase